MSLDPRRRHYLNAMGVQAWVLREAVAAEVPQPQAEAIPEAEQVPAPTVDDVAGLDWAALRQRVSECQRCGLAQSRTQTVFGVGHPQAELLVIGEAPGADEDAQGEPFVGRAGQLLNGMLQAIGLKRESVYIANILKCRPPNNRDPQADEVAACEPYLQRQIDLLRPRAILCVGRIAAHNLLKVDTPLGRLRGQVLSYGPQQVPVVVTYHPAYLLRTPTDKAKAWQDLLRLKAMGLSGGDSA